MASELTPTSFLPYHEPGIVTILIQTSLLLTLNIVNTIFDHLLFCGLLGQVFIGVAWGTPGAKWLPAETEHVIVQLGYLGLILLVYEGGLETNFRSLKANLFLSTAVAITGISFPMALSFTLKSLSNATPLQAFAAGAALCSTSLGTTFTILSTSGLSSTRLGTVLSSAAMMDDVVGLVMVQVISNLGESAGAFSAVTVVRPVVVSVGLAVAVPLICRFVALPLTGLLNGMRNSNPGGVVDRMCRGSHTAFVLHTLILLGLVTGATYAGTSNLFAAYLAGASVSWWDSEVPHVEAGVKGPSPSSSQQESAVNTNPSTESPESPARDQAARDSDRAENTTSPTIHHFAASTGAEVFHTYYKAALQRILKPFFFASIGFAIPITDMFSGPIIWRGIVYTILMLFAKLITGVWLIRLDISWPRLQIPKTLRSILRIPASCVGLSISKGSSTSRGASQSESVPAVSGQEGIELSQEPIKTTDDAPSQAACSNPPPPRSGPSSSTPSSSHHSSSSPTPAPAPKINKPLSLYPATMLGTAMTARGEIGFLIASLAETTGLFSPSGEPSSESSEIYLVVTWAIVLCTVIGPLGIGTLVKRVRRLQEERRVGKSDRSDPLGIWGVS
ncbi:Sodium/hydrogen exchanger family-domain-containing protein [Rhexocercosporidium sp. MPI-PUGE-AT-0058]|nr:Sodium/hydrogen exchanger family-domain-containing protein [Rhexocercosporidium sp. MPI-PUGE-AT-0058]